MRNLLCIAFGLTTLGIATLGITTLGIATAQTPNVAPASPSPPGSDPANPPGSGPANQSYLTSSGQTVPHPGVPQNSGVTPLDRKIYKRDNAVEHSICSNC